MVDQPLIDSGDASAASNRSLRRLVLLAVVLWCAIPFSPQTVDSDFWGHVRYGQDNWQYGLDREATYTYTAIGHPWINHENLAELIMGWGVWLGGPATLLVLKCLLGVAILGLGIHRASRQRPAIRTEIIAVACIVVSINSSYYWAMRPQVFTFFLFALLIALTDACFEGWAGQWHWGRRASDSGRPQMDVRRLHWLWLAPVLLAIWTNTHGGFLAGVGVYTVILVGRALEVLWVHGRAQWKTAAYLLVLTLAGILATGLNPYGIRLHLWLFDDLKVPRPEILEWHAPAWFTMSALKLWVLVGLMAWALAASRLPRDVTQLAVLGLVVMEAFKHQRHIPFAAVLFLFWCPAHLQSAADRLAQGRLPLKLPPAGSPAMRLVTGSLIVLCMLFAFRVGTRLSGMAVSNYEYPVDAVQYMADQNLTGRLVVHGKWAQYVLAVLGARSPEEPGISVAFDGRFRTCYPQHVADMHFDFFLGDGGPEKRYRSPDSPAADPKRILEYHDPQLVLIHRHELHPVTVMRSVQDKWVLLYQDQIAQLWGRRSLFDPQQHVSDQPPVTRQVSIARPAVAVAWPAAPQPLDAQTVFTTSTRASDEPTRNLQ